MSERFISTKIYPKNCKLVILGVDTSRKQAWRRYWIRFNAKERIVKRTLERYSSIQSPI